MKKSNKLFSFFIFGFILCFGNVFSMEGNGEIPIEGQAPVDPNRLLIQALQEALHPTTQALQAFPQALQNSFQPMYQALQDELQGLTQVVANGQTEQTVQLRNLEQAIRISQQADPLLLQGLQDIKIAIKPPKSKWDKLKKLCWNVTWPVRWVPRAAGLAFAVLTGYEVGKWIQFRFLTQDLPKAGYYLANISENGKFSLGCFLASELSQTVYDLLFERKQTIRNLVVVVVTGAVVTIKYL